MKKISIIEGDLFEKIKPHNNISVCHTVSADLSMSKGIAVLFKNKYGKVDELKSMNPKVGKALLLKEGENYIGYLITKKNYWNLPTRDDFKSAVKDYYKQLKELNVKSVYLPKIGAGLDRLPIM